MSTTNIASMNMAELEAHIISLGEKKYRAKQIYEWLHQKHAEDFSEMTNLSATLRTVLADKHEIPTVKIERKYESFGHDVCKYLLKMPRDTIIESVLMKYSFGLSLCVSSQAGCAMGCAFCMSGADGLLRNLEAYEILAQVYRAQEDSGERVNNIVIMGSGEPLHNFDAVVRFIEIISSEEGLNIGRRHITLSTCGIVPKIYALADKKLGVNLALSLHAANDDTRCKVMPVANTYSLDETLKACDYYSAVTGRRVTYEYALMAGVNDSGGDAHALAKRLRGRLCHVNLIPVNDGGGKFSRPSNKVIQNFYDILCKLNVDTTIRRELGSDIAAACGQLKSEFVGIPL